MSTPSETMFTATIQGSRPSRKRSSFTCARGSLCSTTTGARPVISASTRAIARAWSVSAATTSPPASRCPPSRTEVSLSWALRRIRGSPSGSSVEIAVRNRRPRSREATTSSNDDSITSSPDCHWRTPS